MLNFFIPCDIAYIYNHRFEFLQLALMILSQLRTKKLQFDLLYCRYNLNFLQLPLETGSRSQNYLFNKKFTAVSSARMVWYTTVIKTIFGDNIWLQLEPKINDFGFATLKKKGLDQQHWSTGHRNMMTSLLKPTFLPESLSILSPKNTCSFAYNFPS